MKKEKDVLYFDRYNIRFCKEKDADAPEKQYVAYYHDNDSGKLSETHYVDEDTTLVFEFSYKDQEDPLRLWSLRNKFFKKHNIVYDGNEDRYYTTEMVITKDHFDRIKESL